jgi:hypothetical protein
MDVDVKTVGRTESRTRAQKLRPCKYDSIYEKIKFQFWTMADGINRDFMLG